MTDKHVNAAGKLLQQQFPEQHGLQDTLLLQEKLLWSGDSSNFVQIININRTHWVCVSNVGCEQGAVNIYDSLPCVKSATLAVQVAAIIRSSTTKIKLSVVDIQRQTGGSDCALFAIACTTAICHGLDPSTCSYDQSKMRDHLLFSFEVGSVSVFPSSSKPRRKTMSKILSTNSVPIYCNCRLPWNRQGKFSKDLVQCGKCREWFHDECEGIPVCVKESKGSKWNCHKCC